MMSSENTIVEASIEDLSSALATNRITSVDLVAKYLVRIANYDCRNTTLNAVPLLNENVFTEAAAADDRRACGRSHGTLDGVPFTVKDSYKVKGMTVACGSEAFEKLVANEDAFVVNALRRSGAVLMGKTNMCPMAYGGMIRGLYGRAESPYNPDYLAAAFGSGSSNGSGVATASSFAAFGMGGETVSSGRSPASNNALVTYTPSRGYISVRGTWPLYPTCDVTIPHTRSMDDLLVLLDIITASDPITSGDFWRDQPFMSLPSSWLNKPKHFPTIKDPSHLKGKRIAVPRIYIKQSQTGPHVSKPVSGIWEQTRATIESSGATVIIIDDFPALTAYHNPQSESATSPRLPQNWNATERGTLIAQAWEDFLSSNADSTTSSLAGVQPTKMFPHLPPSDPQIRFTEPANAVKWSQLASYVADRPQESVNHSSKSPIYDTPRLETAVHALEDMRKHYFEDWLVANKYDYVAFPAVGDVARADADVNIDSAEHAWRNGVMYSHGNRMLRHLGIPSVTVPMGTLENSGMPIGLTALGKSGDDVELLKFGWCFEQAVKKEGRGRSVPGRTPSLETDSIYSATGSENRASRGPRIGLDVTKCLVTPASDHDEQLTVTIKGSITLLEHPDSTSNSATGSPSIDDTRIEIYIDGKLISPSQIPTTQISQDGQTSASLSFTCDYLTDRPPSQDARNAVVGKIARDSTMIMILARLGEHGLPSGFLKLVHVSDVHKD